MTHLKRSGNTFPTLLGQLLIPYLIEKSLIEVNHDTMQKYHMAHYENNAERSLKAVVTRSDERRYREKRREETPHFMQKNQK